MSDFPKLMKLKVSDINTDYDSNPRVLNETKFDALKDSLKKFGNIQPIVVNNRTNNLISGHQRLRIMSKESDTIDVWMVDVDEFKENAAAIALNNEVANYDQDMLKDIVESIDKENIHLTGFDDLEIKKITEEIDDSFMQGTEELSEKIDIYKTTLEFDSLENKFRWESFIETCKLKAKHERPVTDYMFEIINNQ
jgi:ParB-like chromosome segregation protein Spo0J